MVWMHIGVGLEFVIGDWIPFIIYSLMFEKEHIQTMFLAIEVFEEKEIIPLANAFFQEKTSCYLTQKIHRSGLYWKKCNV